MLPAALPTDTSLRDRLARLDHAASRRLAAGLPHPRWLTAPLGLLSRSANHGWLWYALALLPWLAGEPRPLARALYVAVPVTAVELLGGAVKRVVRRPRPSAADPGQAPHIPVPSSPSFPSSHASMAVVGTFTLGALAPAWLPALVALTAVLAFSRVYLGVHYLGDVVAGLLLGLAVGGATVLTVAPPL